MQLTEVKKGQVGTGLLIENDGYVSINSEENKLLKEAFENGGTKNIPNPFIVSAVFQKYGIENANGRIYPEDILKREVQKYQQAIKERRAYGECYTPDALCLTKNGWRNIDTIEPKDEVLTLNTKTKATEYQKVTHTVKHKYNGYLIHVTSDYIDDKVTPNHSYPIFTDDKTFYDFVTVDDLRKNKKLYEKYIIPLSQDINSGDSQFEKISNLNFEDFNYNNYVHCIEVPNHTWFVRQNGKEHWTKNCNHPESSCIDLGRIAMNVIELHWEGRTLVGKMEIPISDGFRNLGVVSTCADMVAQWILSGLKIGVSSRGLGSVTQQMGKLIVGSDFEIVCWDVVSQPSTKGSFIDINPENLKQYIESKQTDKQIVTENNDDKFSKFKAWLTD